ncbi:MAG: zinc-ribbon domain-containing protein [Lachnospiraceae bacterium]|nr:zinc-ribbon domain-containing protein [Lachnospiraceae bacterium]
MKCPKCGREVPDGKMYCENCGEEIMIVPEFEPEVDKTLTDVMSDVTTNLLVEEEQQTLKKAKNKSVLLFAIAFLVVLFLSGIVFEIVTYVNRNSVSYQFAHAKEAMEDGRYDDVILYASRVAELESTNLEARLLGAVAYARKGDEKKAIDAYKQILSIDAQNEEALDGIISIYEKENNVSEIMKILSGVKDSSIKEKYVRFSAGLPSFSKQAGTYREEVFLEITSAGNGSIYYTLDGTTPSDKSSRYTSPIKLPEGTCTVKALYINSYGVKSGVASADYDIILKEAHEPKISLETGAYTQPKMIVVSVPENEKVYYTTDGSEPDRSSSRYTKPIPLPFGNSRFRFVSIVDDEVKSEVVACNYNFTFDAVTSRELALIMLNDYLLQHGILADANGSIPGKPGNNLYFCNTAISLNNRNYYLIEEYYNDGGGNISPTGILYCVGAENGQLFTASEDDTGHFSIVSIG